MLPIGYVGFAARAALFIAIALAAVEVPQAAHAAELLPSSLVDVFRDWVNSIEALGPLGPLLFIATVATVECVPFLPTQPFSVASGLIFGPQKGAVFMLLGLVLAATNAYFISRGVGRGFADRVVAAELSGEGDASNAISRRFAKLNRVMESGTTTQQIFALILLRLTPVVPYSASNYVLGASPIKYPVFIAGTAVGMAVWSVIFASVGAAGRVLLDGGEDIVSVLAMVGEQATEKSQVIGAYGLGLVGVVAAAYAVKQRVAKQVAD